MYLKNLTLVNDDVGPFDLNQIIWARPTRANDIIVIPNMPTVIIDPAAEIPGKGHRLLIDATSSMPPDPAGADVKIVTPPRGAEINELARIIRQLQRESESR